MRAFIIGFCIHPLSVTASLKSIMRKGERVASAKSTFDGRQTKRLLRFLVSQTPDEMFSSRSVSESLGKIFFFDESRDDFHGLGLRQLEDVSRGKDARKSFYDEIWYLNASADKNKNKKKHFNRKSDWQIRFQIDQPDTLGCRNLWRAQIKFS